MANTYNTLNDLFVAIANAIRAKKGTAESIIADDFPEEIESIETSGGNSPEAELALTWFADRAESNNHSYMFYDCRSLTTSPLFDTSESTNMSSMFGNCTSLIAVPLYDTSKVTNMNTMFGNCTSLITVPLFDTSKVTNMANMFYYCKSLTTVPLFDISNVTAMHYMFMGCTNLTDCYLRNIKVNLQVGSGITYGHLLTVDSLVHLIYECRDTGSQKTLTIGNSNIAKLANVYVRTIAITDEMRAEDSYIDEKLPFEVCDSTDEGAMLIIDYANEKNWAIA